MDTPSPPRTSAKVSPDPDSLHPRLSKFRFKEKEGRHSESYHSAAPSSSSSLSRRHHHRRHHHHRSKRRKTDCQPPNDDPSAYDDTYLPNATSHNYMHPDDAFRESLFDAMADDEGAAFWEGVYGQPIHGYSNVKAKEAGDDQGELERMDDEEYASYVRAKMWEKTHEAVLEERRRREEERRWRKERLKEENERGGRNREFERQVEESLRRGDVRKERKVWRERWRVYLANWEELRKLVEIGDDNGEEKKVHLRNKISWPVESGKRKDICKEEVERFFRNAPSSSAAAGGGGGGGGVDNKDAAELRTVLKIERVRWHPDKIQQRYGGLGIDESTMKAVTAVFQVIDRMWNEERERMN